MYLLTLALPPEGTGCEAEFDPFAPALPTGEAVGAEMDRTGRSALLPEATKRALRG